MRKLGGRLRASGRTAVVASLATVVAIAAAGTVLAAVGDVSCQPGQPEEDEKPTDT
jgi:hypothetical protein